MKKFKLQRGFIAGALGATMFLTGCSNTVDNTINGTITSDVAINSDVTLNNEENTNDVTINSAVTLESEENTDTNLLSNDQDLNMPITAEIEQVELEDSEIGYKLPAGYFPFNVNDEYHLPALLCLVEATEEYTIFALPNEKDKYGNDVECSFEGAIGVYEPYVKLLASKKEILNKYGKAVHIETIDGYSYATEYNVYTTIEDYSFATEEEQKILNAVDILYNQVSEEYSASKGESLKK